MRLAGAWQNGVPRFATVFELFEPVGAVHARHTIVCLRGLPAELSGQVLCRDEGCPARDVLSVLIEHRGHLQQLGLQEEHMLLHDADLAAHTREHTTFWRGALGRRVCAVALYKRGKKLLLQSLDSTAAATTAGTAGWISLWNVVGFRRAFVFSCGRRLRLPCHRRHRSAEPGPPTHGGCSHRRGCKRARGLHGHRAEHVRSVCEPALPSALALADRREIHAELCSEEVWASHQLLLPMRPRARLAPLAAALGEVFTHLGLAEHDNFDGRSP
mmetsp:Transcript_121430/g.388334  ORF Transcript_121430/g.388334 Transcript_121430/m.388334 type:complete len:272 (+) Transcript_121430:202-1017(+)